MKKGTASHFYHIQCCTYVACAIEIHKVLIIGGGFVRLFFKLLSICVLFLTPSAAQAGMIIVVPTHTAVNQTTASIGFRFEFGDTVSPSVVGSVRQTHTDTSNNVSGGMLDLSLPFGPGDNFMPTIRLMGIIGNTDVQGIGGVGFDFGEGQGVVSGGVQIRNFQFGSHFSFGGQFEPYVDISTYGGPPTRGTTFGPPAPDPE